MQSTDILLEVGLELKRKCSETPQNVLPDLGVVFPPKLQKPLEDILFGGVTRAVFKAPRGGGKSYLASVIEFLLWHCYDYDWVNMGGSLHQAETVYNYLSDFMKKIPCGVSRSVRALTEKASGPKLRCLAASEKQTRAPHVGDKFRGGGLTIDEEVECEPGIVASALPIVNTAHPSVVLRLSTFHKAYGSFQELWDNASRLGYSQYEWDCFDVCEKCPDDCLECYPEFRETYCKGKARFTQNGWLDIKEIKQAWVESQMNREWFEIEFMGSRPSIKSLVYDPKDIDLAIVEDFEFVKGYPTWIGCDWGFESECCVICVQKVEKEVGLLECEYFTQAPLEEIKEKVVWMYEKYSSENFNGDGSGVFENNAIENAGCKVHPVNFNKEKSSGISHVKNHFEHGWIKIPKRFVHLINQLKNYRRDKFGKPVKKDDHGPDALMCAFEPTKVIAREVHELKAEVV